MVRGAGRTVSIGYCPTGAVPLLSLTPAPVAAMLGLFNQREVFAVSDQETFLNAAMREQAIGLEGPPAVMEVEKGHILRFAEAIGDPNIQWTDEAAARQGRYGGLTAPPTFLRAMRGATVELPFALSFGRRLDAGSDWAYFQPVRPGDRITAIARIADLTERRGRLGLMVFLTTITTYRNQFAEVVATQTNTLIAY